MKKAVTLSMISLLALYLAGCKQTESLSTTVPAAVSAAFAAKFPKAKSVEWGKEGEKEYEAEFKLSGKEMSANFSETGEWMETEAEINPQDLPAAVSESIALNFAGYDVEEVEVVEKPEGATVYEVEMEKGEKSIEVVFSENGQVLSQEDEGDDDGNDENGHKDDDDGEK